MTAPHPHDALVDRIIGIEVEYGVATTTDDGPVSPDDTARAMFRPINEAFGSTNIFTTNGSRLYLDVGSHPEWATAECSTLDQVIAYEKAGDVVINRLATHAEQLLAGEYSNPKVYVLKNNVDSIGNSYGCHENYLVGRQVVLKSLGAQFLPFLITRQLICGAGKLFRPHATVSSDYGPGWCVSQRADHVWETVSSATTRSRPIINTRDEPHADSRKWRRLHVIVGDSSMSEPTIALKIGATCLVLEMIEAGWRFDHLELAGDIDTIRAVARSPYGEVDCALASGAHETALGIQQAYLDAAGNWLDIRPDPAPGTGTPTDQLRRVHRLWASVLAALRAGDTKGCVRDIDWMIKKNLLDSYAAQHGLGPLSDRLAQLDFAYHDIRPGRGLFDLLTKKNKVNRWISDNDITRAVDHAPETTRAHIRAQFLQRARETNTPHTVDWMRVKVTKPEPKVVELLDPFATHDDDVEALIRSMGETSVS